MPDKEPGNRKPPTTREGLPSGARTRGEGGPPRRRVIGRDDTSNLPTKQSNSPGREVPRRDSAVPTRPIERRDVASPRRDGSTPGRPTERRYTAPSHRDGVRSTDNVAPGRPLERGTLARGYGERGELRSSRPVGVRSEKRDRFLADRSQQNKRKAWLFVGLPVVLVVVVGAVLYFVAGDSVGIKSGAGLRRSSGIFTTAVPDNGVVRLPVADFQDGKARFYTYKTVANKEIDFFVLRSSDGVIRAAIDSCDVCFTYRKGYHQEGDEMVCNNCGQRFPSIKINVIKGGCNPAPLTRNVEDDILIIKEKDIIADGDQYF